MQNEAAWQYCWRASLDFARKGIMIGAMSGLDMAMMDLKGKLLNVSASELMGGRLRDKLPCYATGMYFRKIPETQLLELILKEAADYVGQGYQALKIKIGKNIAFDKQLAVEIRRAFRSIRLMADANHAYDLPEAIGVGRVLDENEYEWFEEPLSPEFPLLYRQLHNKLDLPLATGESEQTRWGFQTLLTAGGVQIAQPDMGYCGGPSEAIKIRSIASALGVNVIPHVWGTMLNLACATHFLASTYIEPGRTEAVEALLEIDQTANPMKDEMYAVSLDVEDGMVKVPTTPGLGVEPDRSAMKAFCVQKTEK